MTQAPRPPAQLGSVRARFGLTARALRHYEDRGLITAGRDRLGHRVYDLRAQERLAWIALLRRAGVSLRDVAQVLETDQPSVARASAAAKLNARLSAALAQVNAIEEALLEVGQGRHDTERGGPVRPDGGRPAATGQAHQFRAAACYPRLYALAWTSRLPGYPLVSTPKVLAGSPSHN